jgi:hypothetical protein
MIHERTEWAIFVNEINIKRTVNYDAGIRGIETMVTKDKLFSDAVSCTVDNS